MESVDSIDKGTEKYIASAKPRFMGRLALTKSDGEVRYFNIKKSIQIGRGSECDIRIKVKTVSRIHCKVKVVTADDALPQDFSVPAQYMLENISATNFTILNAQEVKTEVMLHDGDIITVAERDFVFQVVDTRDIANQDNKTMTGTNKIKLTYEEDSGDNAEAVDVTAISTISPAKKSTSPPRSPIRQRTPPRPRSPAPTSPRVLVPASAPVPVLTSASVTVSASVPLSEVEPTSELSTDPVSVDAAPTVDPSVSESSSPSALYTIFCGAVPPKAAASENGSMCAVM
jgi:pSer/pThr/pTyr-binding forkhead associated (FHA) protein